MKDILTSEFEQLVHDDIFNYFSITIFDRTDNLTVSSCTNDEWMYNNYAKYCPNPPVQKHIKRMKNGLIFWNEDEYDPQTNIFIADRNTVCETKVIVTFVGSNAHTKYAISFGSKNDKNQIRNVYEKRKSIFVKQFSLILAAN